MEYTTRSPVHSFFSNFITAKQYLTPNSNIKHPFPNNFLYCFSPDFKVFGYKHILNQSLYNLAPSRCVTSYCYNKYVARKKPNQVGKKLCTKIFRRFFLGHKNYSTQITRTPRQSSVLSKLSFYKIHGCVPSQTFKEKIFKFMFSFSVSGVFRHYYSKGFIRPSLPLKSHSKGLIRPSLPLKIHSKGLIRPSLPLKGNIKFGHVGRCMKHVCDHVRDYRVLYLIGVGIVVTLAFGRLETIPYSKRKHILLIPPNKDKKIGDFLFEAEPLTLSEKHPDSIRVRSISNRIIEALEMDLGIKRRDLSNLGSKGVTTNVVDVDEEKKVVKVGKHRRNKYSVGHLEGLNWDVMVVDAPTPNAYCLPGGKIVVYTGLLKYLKSDAEIATVIGHEVGHVIARHVAGSFTMELWISIARIIIWSFFGGGNAPNHHLTEAMRQLILELPLSRRDEKEADYIGLQIMANAGYDPREALKVYKLFDQLAGESSEFKDFFSTHPAGNKRAEALAKDEAMGEAISRFSRAIKQRKNELEDGTYNYSTNYLNDRLSQIFTGRSWA